VNGRIVVELAGEPKSQARPRFVRRTGIAFTPAMTRQYAAALRLAAQQAMDGRAPLEGPVQVDILALFPVPKGWSRRKREAALAGETLPQVRPDWDNLAKQLDSFNQVVWCDDRQVVTGTVRKRYAERPCLRIEISRVEMTALLEGVP
jgi:Holliday junction resolvase RusA-like endonuclease